MPAAPSKTAPKKKAAKKKPAVAPAKPKFGYQKIADKMLDRDSDGM